MKYYKSVQIEIDGLPLTETMKCFGILGMVKLAEGWHVRLSNGKTIIVPYEVGDWLATNKLPTEK